MSDLEFEYWTSIDWDKLNLREFTKLSRGFNAYYNKFKEENKALESINYFTGMNIVHTDLYNWLERQGFQPSKDQFGEEIGIMVDAVWLLVMIQKSEVAIPGHAEWVRHMDTRLKWVVVMPEDEND